MGEMLKIADPDRDADSVGAAAADRVTVEVAEGAQIFRQRLLRNARCTLSETTSAPLEWPFFSACSDSPRVLLELQVLTGRYRLGVRTRGSQPRDRGSNPRTATKSQPATRQ
jgi:hypothetical protein